MDSIDQIAAGFFSPYSMFKQGVIFTPHEGYQSSPINQMLLDNDEPPVREMIFDESDRSIAN